MQVRLIIECCAAWNAAGLFYAAGIRGDLATHQAQVWRRSRMQLHLCERGDLEMA